MAVDIRGHLGVPEAGLVSEMDTGFQHFAHGHGHVELRRLGLESRHTLPRAWRPRLPCGKPSSTTVALDHNTLIAGFACSGLPGRFASIGTCRYLETELPAAPFSPGSARCRMATQKNPKSIAGGAVLRAGFGSKTRGEAR